MAALAALAASGAACNTILAGILMWAAPAGAKQDRTGTPLRYNQKRSAQSEIDAMKKAKILSVTGP
jgi:hypothetical protein